MTRLIPTLSLALLAGLAGCRGRDSGVPDRRTLIDSRDDADPRSLDPARATDVPTGRAVGYVFDGLLRLTPDAQLEPALAERWEKSPDGRRYTFHLRRGVKFHDGRPFTAGNVIRSFERVIARGELSWPLLPIRGARQFQAQETRSVSGLSAPDDSTVVITLTEPLWIFPKLLAMPVAVITPDSVPDDFGEHPIGTGAWRFVEWRHDDYVLFARNPEYFDGPPTADSLMARIVPEPSTAVAEFQNGTVDVLFIPESDTDTWLNDPAKKDLVRSSASLRLWYVGINTRRGVLTDARVRRAINHAVNVSETLAELMGGRGRVAAGVIPPSLEGADTLRPSYPYDTARARQLLAEAGHPNGVDLELWHSTNPTVSRLAQTIQSFLAVSGIRVKLVQRDGPSVREAARNGQTDLVLKDWWADYPDAENFLYPLLHSANVGAGGNVSFYANPAYDQLVTRARREQRDSVRITLYRQADSLAFVDAPMLYLFFGADLFAVQSWVHGFDIPIIYNGQRWTKVTLGAAPNRAPSNAAPAPPPPPQAASPQAAPPPANDSSRPPPPPR
jgi:peptide/nickel transport system substrate-binding protein/oligopeptide transport system substrate-binding protein